MTDQLKWYVAGQTPFQRNIQINDLPEAIEEEIEEIREYKIKQHGRY